MRLLIASSESKFVYMKELADAVSRQDVKCKLVKEVEYSTGFPSKKISEWFSNKKFEKLFNVNASYTSHIRAERGRRLGDSEAHGILKSHGENNDIHKGYNNIFNEALKDLKKLFSDESNFYQEINKEWEEIQNLRSTLNAVHTTDIPRAYTILAKILEIVEEETPPAPEA